MYSRSGINGFLDEPLSNVFLFYFYIKYDLYFLIHQNIKEKRKIIQILSGIYNDF